MSETSILPQAAVEPEGQAPGDGDEPRGGDRRRLMVVGGVAGVVVVGAAAFLLLHKGSSDNTATGAVPRGVVHSAPAPQGAGGAASHHTAKHATAAKPTSHKPAALPKAAKHTQVRDPFKPLVTAPVTTSGGPVSTTTVTAPTGSTGSTTTSTSSTGSTTGSTTSTSGTGSTTTTKGSPTPAGAQPQWIQLRATHGQLAVFYVGYAHHKFRKFRVEAPRPGSHQATVFDKVFALFTVRNGAVTIQIGDARPFTLKTGVARAV